MPDPQVSRTRGLHCQLRTSGFPCGQHVCLAWPWHPARHASRGVVQIPMLHHWTCAAPGLPCRQLQTLHDEVDDLRSGILTGRTKLMKCRPSRSRVHKLLAGKQREQEPNCPRTACTKSLWLGFGFKSLWFRVRVLNPKTLCPQAAVSRSPASPLHTAHNVGDHALPSQVNGMRRTPPPLWISHPRPLRQTPSSPPRSPPPPRPKPPPLQPSPRAYCPPLPAPAPARPAAAPQPPRPPPLAAPWLPLTLTPPRVAPPRLATPPRRVTPMRQ
jgi:hypothetical protein